MTRIITYDNNKSGAQTVLLSGSFTLAGVATPVDPSTFANTDTQAVALIEQAGLLAYRVTLKTGNSRYALQGSSKSNYAIVPAIKVAAGVEHSIQADRLVNDGPGLAGLPADNQFDIIVWLAGSGVRTAAVEASWVLIGDERPTKVRSG